MTDDVDAALSRVVERIGGQVREGQREMAQATRRAMADGRHLLVQAGTGTGKSFGYLVPAALQAIESGPVVVATATLALQRQLLGHDLPTVAAALEDSLPRPLRYAVLKGRNNYVCLERLHRDPATAEDEQAVLIETAPGSLSSHARAVMEWARHTETGDRDEFDGAIDARVWRALSVGRRECVGEQSCAFGAECFTALRRAQAADADIVVTNHALLSVHHLEGIPVLPEHSALVIDEAHELAERATQALTVELTARGIETAASRVRRLGGAQSEAQIAADALLDAAEDFAEALRRTPAGRLRTGAQAAPAGETGRRRAGAADPLGDPGRDLLLSLTRVRDTARAALSALPDLDPDDPGPRQRARAALDDVFEVSGRLIALGSDDVAWADPRAGALHIAPLDVSQRLARGIFMGAPAVLTSATLTIGGSFDPLMRAVGLEAGEADTLDAGSPFDYARQGILYVAEHLPPPGRDGIPEEALDEIGDLIDAAGGRTLVLCSSWRAVDRVGEYLGVRSATEVLVQRRGEPVGPLVEEFAADPATSLVGTLSLWQGVDLPGGTCIQVILDRIPFPRPDDPVMSARQEAVDASGGSGFRSVAVPRAGLLLAQGAGRLIRTPTDRGVVAVLDSRLARAGYAAELRASLPPLWATTDRARVIGALRRLAESSNDVGDQGRQAGRLRRPNGDPGR